MRGRKACMLAGLCSIVMTCPACWFAAPPGQPESGPGGSAYAHAAVAKSQHGQDAETYWLFEPAEPTPNAAPLIVFNHGWSALEPSAYIVWIEHLVMRGNIVLYPRYQPKRFGPQFSEYLPNAISAVKSGIAELQAGEHVRPDLTRVAVVGHSMGGMLAVNMAAVAASEGLPQFKAVMCVEPFGPEPGADWDGLLEDLGQIPAGTLLISVAGEDDGVVGDGAARRYYLEATQIDPEDKDFVLLLTDRYGRPALEADHMAPVAMGEAVNRGLLGGLVRLVLRGGDVEVDAMDFYGTWKLFDGLTDAAFYGTNREYALGDTPEQRFMGLWSDGTAVTELIVSDDP
jgi:dienelactone hydrolase